MRFYYIFSIKEEIMKTLNNNTEGLYKVLESIYKLNKSEVLIGFKVFEKTCNFIDKKNISSLIKSLNFDNYNYTCFRNTHIINDFYNNENTKLTINNSHMTITTNVAYPIFFKQIRNMKNIFVCDFVNEDYFFLRSIIKKEFKNKKVNSIINKKYL